MSTGLRTQRRRRPELPLVPLIDVLVMLVLFAFVTMRFSASRTLNITVPKVQTAGQNQFTGSIEIGIGKDGRVSLNGRVVAEAELEGALREIQKINRNTTVLVRGETGTGKELIAGAIHHNSLRATRNFIKVNCAALQENLLESELFGHEKGAFTGADKQRIGRFEQADGGTLFLDEIGDMPFDLQTRLLRVLSDGQFYRVGGHQPLKANVRVIAATHQNLEQRVRDGAFREDLFHRLNVIRLRLPPLRERAEDVPALARFFLQKSAKELGVEPKRITDEALERLKAFSFPGNVRQLENVCHWLTVMAPAQVIESKDLPPEILSQSPVAEPPAAVPTSV